MLRIALCQINLTVGDLQGNAERICEALREAEAAGADLAAFPELAVSGYPPEDLLFKQRFLRDCHTAVVQVAAETSSCAAVVGLPLLDEATGAVYNAAAVCAAGGIAGFARKSHLPNYGVFDELRWFTPGSPGPLFRISDANIGVSICEDIWIDGGAVNRLAEAGAELILNINASPYCMGKPAQRISLLSQRAGEIHRPVAYLNLVGGQDELVFDGNSMFVMPDGRPGAHASSFAEQVLVVDAVPEEVSAPVSPEVGLVVVSELCPPLPAKPTPEDLVESPLSSADSSWETPRSNALREVPPRPRAEVSVSQSLDIQVLSSSLSEPAEVYEALVMGTRDYVLKNGFSSVCLGLSGGVDSSLTAAIACDALGAANVLCVLMPSLYSSAHSIEDAERLGKNLAAERLLIPIEDIRTVVEETLAPVFGELPADLTEENIQPRIRALLLMAIANKFGRLLLATGNKTELAAGYSTLYGDTAGAFAPIKDIWKLQVYELARYRNERAGHSLIPERVFTKPPSAELRPDQRDDESLPPYEILDTIVRAMTEEDKTPEEILSPDFDLVKKVARMLDAAEFKRRQCPPGVRVSAKAFGKDRRMPIVNRYCL